MWDPLIKRLILESGHEGMGEMRCPAEWQGKGIGPSQLPAAH